MRNFNVDFMRIFFAIIIVYCHLGVMKMVPKEAAGPAVVFFTQFYNRNGAT